MKRRAYLCCGLGLAALQTLAVAAERALDKEVVLSATLDQAWAAWTTRDGIRSFFAPDAVVDPRVGGAFHIYMDPGGEPGMKGRGGAKSVC